MREDELLKLAESAKARLAALAAVATRESASPRSTEFVDALRDFEGLLETLQARSELLRELVARTSDLVFAKDRDGRYVMISPRGASLLGKTVAEVLGRDDRELLTSEDAARIRAIDLRVMRTGDQNTRDETCVLLGAPVTLLTTTAPWYDDALQIRGIIGVAQDVTERRRSDLAASTDHDNMQSMATEIVISEESLRRSLAAELQDGLGQDIALARMKLAALRASSSVADLGALNGIDQHVEHADHSLRSVTYKISPPSLHDLGLVAALQWLGEDIGKQYGIEVRIDDGNSPNVLDERVRVILYRAVRELLINAATHANVRSVVVELSRDDDSLRIKVIDTGVGFDSADQALHGHGLLGIREQLKYVHGSKRIESAPGRGTTVTLTAPTSAPEAFSKAYVESDTTRPGSTRATG